MQFDGNQRITRYEIGRTITAYMTFVKYKHMKKKTYEVEVTSNDHYVLGNIEWKPGWRRYVFAPEADSEFDSLCLRQISSYIDELMEERKEARKQ